MIQDIRVCALCDRYEKPALGLNLFGVVDRNLVVGSRPAIIPIYAALIFDLDGKATSGKITVASADIVMTTADIPMFLPVTTEGPLTITIRDDNPRVKPFKFKWAISFPADAPVLTADEIEDVMNAAVAAGMDAELLNAMRATRH